MKFFHRLQKMAKGKIRLVNIAPEEAGAMEFIEARHVELICDEIHIHPAMIRVTFRMFGAERIIMISDSMRAAGLADGKYTLGGQEVFVKGKQATLQDHTIAGSVTNLMDCVRFAVQQAHIPLVDVIACVTMNPARKIGIYDICGSIWIGKDADIVLLDQNLELQKVWVKGNKWIK